MPFNNPPIVQNASAALALVMAVLLEGDQGSYSGPQNPRSKALSVFDIALRYGVLSFARKDEDDIDRFEMQLVDDADELTFLLSPDERDEQSSQGISAIQPVTLRRTTQLTLIVNARGRRVQRMSGGTH